MHHSIIIVVRALHSWSMSPFSTPWNPTSENSFCKSSNSSWTKSEGTGPRGRPTPGMPRSWPRHSNTSIRSSIRITRSAIGPPPLQNRTRARPPPAARARRSSRRRHCGRRPSSILPCSTSFLAIPIPRIVTGEPTTRQD